MGIVFEPPTPIDEPEPDCAASTPARAGAVAEETREPAVERAAVARRHPGHAGRVLKLLADGACRTPEIERRLGLTQEQANSVLHGLRRRGLIEAVVRGVWRLVPPDAAPAPPPVPAPRHLTLVPSQGHMLCERGDRDDTCSRYTACLDAHVRAYREAPASCPEACEWRERVQERATDHMYGPR
jgi:hypothetical protein